MIKLIYIFVNTKNKKKTSVGDQPRQSCLGLKLFAEIFEGLFVQMLQQVFDVKRSTVLGKLLVMFHPALR